MAAVTVCAAAKPVAAPTRAFSGLRQQPAVFSKPCVDRQFAAVRRSVKAQRKGASALQARASMEVAQLAGEAGFIFGVSGVMVAMTLIGLAVGFVLLRVESLAEEGKI